MSRIRRMLFVSGILLVCAWTLVPIYLVALGGLGGAATVYAWPKPFWRCRGAVAGLRRLVLWLRKPAKST